MLILSLVIALALFAATGCTATTPAEHSTTRPQTIAPTPEQCRQAVIDLIRRRRGAFMGKPDPEILSGLPLVDLGTGEYRFGAIYVSPAIRRYHAEIGLDGPHGYFYSGDIEWKEGAWVAAGPEVMHAHLREPR